MTTMYSITNRSSGLNLGVYAATCEADAIDVMSRDAGYESTADAAETLGQTVRAYCADLIVTEA